MTKVVELTGPLTEAQGARVAAAIRSAKGVVDLRINSPGGRYGSAIAIALEIEESAHAVVTTILGEACSAAALVALAGDQRRICEGGSMMVHFPAPSPRYRTSADERARTAAEHFRAICEYLPDAQPADVRQWMSEERHFTAREALAAGLVDRIASVSATPTVFVREPRKRAPTAWLRSWRDFHERHDLRAA
ncbi:ATP-dependent Clp protease proteolytic subunit [Reyranella sp.]|uniref:ATP-dependent Clp protease proteolytic subunit n=1 Tax=Reyranella sp. TaxID=1929291 RepID=UPI003D0DFA29